MKYKPVSRPCPVWPASGSLVQDICSGLLPPVTRREWVVSCFIQLSIIITDNEIIIIIITDIKIIIMEILMRYVLAWMGALGIMNVYFCRLVCQSYGAVNDTVHISGSTWAQLLLPWWVLTAEDPTTQWVTCVLTETWSPLSSSTLPWVRESSAGARESRGWWWAHTTGVTLLLRFQLPG